MNPYKCAHCHSRIYADEQQFEHLGASFCCECMRDLTSWYLDGGTIETPDQFPELGLPR